MKKLLLLITGITMTSCGSKNESLDAEENISKPITEKIKPSYETAMLFLEKGDFDKARFEFNEFSFEDRSNPEVKLFTDAFNNKLDDSIAAIKRELQKIKPQINTNYDKFDGITWYKSRFDQSNYKSNISVYFGDKKEMGLTEPRLVFTYYGDSWIFWETVKILIDGEAFEYRPVARPERSNSSSVWETSDEVVSSKDEILLEKIINAKSVSYRFEGDNGIADFTLNKARRDDIRNVLKYRELVRAERWTSAIDKIN